MKPINFSPIVRIIAKLLLIFAPVFSQPAHGNPIKYNYALTLRADVPETLGGDNAR